ncbi:MAG: UDP-N-acetylmuramate--L-alanine ligase [Saprospiraceae bacterium]
MELDKIRNIYFIGIGGIGMSGLARYFHAMGVNVAGYDRTESELTRNLAAEGMQIHYTEDLSQIPANVDLVVYTPAVPVTHLEYVHFQQNGFNIMKRSQVLGMISRSKKCIAIAGTHGKTTTSTIVTHLLRTCGLDVTAFLGGISVNLASNFVIGQSNWVVVEADEFDRSFLQLSPDIEVITSMDPDHLDIYGSEEEMQRAYVEFGERAKSGGKILLADQIEEAFKADFDGENIALTTYGYRCGIYQSEHLKVEGGKMTFDFHSPKGSYSHLVFPLPGQHNVQNATAAIAIAQELGMEESGIREGLASFKGVHRRFEIVYQSDTQVLVDDYAHHPKELEAAIAAMRLLYPERTILGAFQPHLYSRTQDFAAGFAASLDMLDIAILLPIYPARELPIPGVSSQMILDLMQSENKHLVEREDLVAFIQAQEADAMMILGAGDIDLLIPAVVNSLADAEHKKERK